MDLESGPESDQAVAHFDKGVAEAPGGSGLLKKEY